MLRTKTAIAGMAAATLIAAMGVALATPAAAASLTEVTNFGSNPGNLRMHVYVPDAVKPTPAIVVAMHPCGGSGPQFYQSSEFGRLADQLGFVVIYPSASKKANCFDNWSEAAKVRGAGTDVDSIISMITYAERQYQGDPSRVYATGSSSGAMMTNAIAALYPDVIKAGAAFMGVPFACFPNEAAYQPGGNPAPCAGTLGKSPQQWGDIVRKANPGYAGPWPRMQLWHGTADNVVAYSELQEEIDQWTNVHGFGTTPTSTDTPQSSWTRQRWTDSGSTRVEAITVAGAGHSLPAGGMAQYAIQFFGLTGTTPPPPDPATGCRVSYRADSWNNGFTASVQVTNTGGSTVNGWQLRWTWPGGQQVTNAWNATVTQSGAEATARNVGWNGPIPQNGSVSFGFQATYTGANSTPAAFTLHGTACTTA
ncbi:MAG: PHB depolymerase family esterase [Kibdelosporangium sp.]